MTKSKWFTRFFDWIIHKKEPSAFEAYDKLIREGKREKDWTSSIIVLCLYVIYNVIVIEGGMG